MLTKQLTGRQGIPGGLCGGTNMIHWFWIIPALAVGWIFGAMMVYIILGGDGDDNNYR